MKTLQRRLGGALTLSVGALLHAGAAAQWFDIAGPGTDQGTAIASNATGQTFIGGTFQGSVDLSAAVTLVGSAPLESYLAMIDGGIAWAVALSSLAGTVSVNEVAPLSDGGVVAVGRFSDDLVPGGLVAVGSSDGFVARYDSAGNVLWAAQVAGDAFDTARGVAVDSEDNIYVTGDFSDSALGTTIFDANGAAMMVHLSSGSDDGYVAAFDVDGLYLWSHAFGGTGFDDGLDVATDSADDVYVTGSFSDVATIASVALTSAGSHDLFVAKYDQAGVSQWAVAGGGSGLDEGRGISTSASGDVLVTGFITDTADFSGLAAVSSGVGDEEVVLARYDASGAIQWVATSGGAFDDRGAAVVETLAGSVAVTGYGDGAFGDILTLFDGAGVVLNSWGPGVFAIGDDITLDLLSGQVRATGDQTGADAFVAVR